MLTFLCVFIVGCSNKDSDGDKNGKDYVVSLSLDEAFVSETFYKGDIVDLSKYTLTVNYKKSKPLTLKLNDDNIHLTGFSTEEVGTFKCNISYQGASVTLYYAVLDVVPAGIFYNGEDLTIYSREVPNFTNVFVDVVYNNGTQGKICLADMNISNIDYTCSHNTKTLTATYLGFNVKVNYKVTNREIKELEIYEFIDNSDLFNEDLKFVAKSGDCFLFYKNTEGEIGFQTNLSSLDFNSYEVWKIANREKVYFTFTLVNNSIICEKR